jgi:hypothetical protein
VNSRKPFLIRNEAGMSMTEVIIAAALLISLAVVGISLVGKRKGFENLTSAASCDNAAADVITAIKELDNQTIVRNWIPKLASGAAGVSGDPIEPFCTGGVRTVCDQSPIISGAGGTFIDTADYRTHLNVRGSHTWAQNLYNQRRGAVPSICSLSADGKPQGITFSPLDLGNILPRLKTLPTTMNTQPPAPISYQLYIKDSVKNCADVSTARNAEFKIVVTVTYRTTEGRPNQCVSSINIVNPPLIAPDPLQIAVTNGAGVVIPNDPGGVGYCTDRRKFGDVPAPGSDNTWQTINFTLQPIRPGSILLCRKNLPVADAIGSYHNCPDMPVGGNLAVTPNDVTVQYNQPLSPIVTMFNMPDTTNATTHEYAINAVDVSGNRTPDVANNFLVHTPSCPNPATYCPNASFAIPADPLTCAACTPGTTPRPACSSCWNNGGDILIRPYDDCLNGECPVGTLPASCNPDPAPYVCDWDFYGDTCGLPRC